MISCNAEAISQLWLADETVENFLGSGILFELDGGHLAYWCRRIGPRNVDAFRRPGQVLIGAVDVDLGLSGSLNWVIAGELGFKLAAIAAGRDRELDEHVLFVGRSCALANSESWKIGCCGLSLRDASDLRVSRGACSGAEDCTGCSEDGAGEKARDEESGSGIHVP